jgi:hypothetical protein
MMMGGNFELDITFLGGVTGTEARDVSGKNHQITDYGGDVTVTDIGTEVPVFFAMPFDTQSAIFLPRQARDKHRKS